MKRRSKRWKLSRRRRYVGLNRERIKAKMAEWRAANPEKVAQHNANRRVVNRAKYAASAQRVHRNPRRSR